MSTTYFLQSTNSDLSGGNDFSKQLLLATGSSTISISIAASATEDSYGFTDPGEPGTIGITGNYSLNLNIMASNANIMCSIAVARVNSSGTQQNISSFTAEQALSTTGTFTFSLSSVNLGTWASGDRLRVTYRFRNTVASIQAATLRANANSFVSAPWTELSGSLAATEAIDTFAASGSLNPAGALATTEAKDTFSSSGIVSDKSGSLAATESPDSFSATDLIPYPQGGVPYVCERCGFEYPFSQLRKEWTGLWVCRKDYDPRPPQLTAPDMKPEGVPRVPSRYPDPNTGPNLTTAADL